MKIAFGYSLLVSHHVEVVRIADVSDDETSGSLKLLGIS
jgi:hypothetical protein